MNINSNTKEVIMQNSLSLMTNKSLVRNFLSLSLIVVLGSILCLTNSSEAKGRSGNFNNSRGGFGTRSVNWSGNQRSGNGTYAGKQGRAWNGSSSGSYDKAIRTYSESKTVTGPQGNSKTYQTQKVGNGMGGSTTSVTGENGNSRTFSTQRSIDKDTNTLNRSVTGPQGNTRERSTQYTNNGDGSYSYNTTDSNGSTSSGAYTANP
jgi:hypothetical protein